MEKERFDLSKELNDILSLNRWGKGENNDEIYNLLKEFIRLLKEEIDNKNNKSSSISKHRVKHLIDWLAGEKLSPNFKTKKQHNTDSNSLKQRD